MTTNRLDRRALGQTLTRLANATVSEALAVDSQTHTHSVARRIGMTGPPGAGKSSLVGRLAQIRSKGIRLGILAIDPTSPKSGGAILGDRIRMDELANINDLYIRSFGSRSATDGLTDNLPELIAAMDAYGFDELLIETVGVGQAEYAIRRQVDTLVLVLLPDSGDAIQAMKAGIMEMADIFVVNKSDLPGAPKMASDVKRTVLMSQPTSNGWTPPVLLTASDDPASIERLSLEIDRHRQHLEQSGTHETLHRERIKYRIRRLIERETARVVNQLDSSVLDATLLEQYQAVLDELQQTLKEGTPVQG
ncbi:MAG: methylmalonyl Co-A mutase-associated GTPase MeaB [Burkholderiaceae bacterium]|nr:methylmalonyl Co-A mutase-associated GTPase MeaB [Burkholderiaceae bacterium]